MKEFKQYKIKAKNLQEKAEIVRLFEGLGYCDHDTDDKCTMVITYHSGCIQSAIDNFFESTAREQITIEQLREMSMKEYLLQINGEYVLRNAAVKPSGAIEVPKGADAARDLDGGIEFYKDDFNLYFDEIEMVWSETNLPQKTLLKWVVWKRESEKKEFLNPCKDGSYELSDFPICEDSIEVPDGAEWAKLWDKGESYECIEFYKGKNEFFSASRKEWMRGADQSTEKLGQPACIIWQRTTQPEELPFIDDEPKHSVDDTLAERQSTYGDFTSVASTTGQLMAIIRNSKNGQTMPYAHDEALHMICCKIARIVNSDHNHKDSWHDIGGYAKLIEDLI